jgi:hypothetical protein
MSTEVEDRHPFTQAEDAIDTAKDEAWRGVFVACHQGLPAATLITLPIRMRMNAAGGLQDELAIAAGPGEQHLEQTLAAFMAAHLGPGMTPDAALIRDLLAVLGRAGLAFPPSSPASSAP